MLGIKYVSGSVEAACGLGLADAVVDLVETGTTMRVRIILGHRTIYEVNKMRISPVCRQLVWKLLQKSSNPKLF